MEFNHLLRRIYSSPISPSPLDQRELGFHSKCTIQGRVCQFSINGGSTANLVSPYLVERLGLSTASHPHPYMLHSYEGMPEVEVSEQAVVEFSVGNVYHDVVLCDVASLGHCHLMLGRPWQYDMQVSHDGYRNTYSFHFEGKQVSLNPILNYPDMIPNSSPIPIGTSHLIKSEVDHSPPESGYEGESHEETTPDVELLDEPNEKRDDENEPSMTSLPSKLPSYANPSDDRREVRESGLFSNILNCHQCYEEYDCVNEEFKVPLMLRDKSTPHRVSSIKLVHSDNAPMRTCTCDPIELAPSNVHPPIHVLTLLFQGSMAKHEFILAPSHRRVWEVPWLQIASTRASNFFGLACTWIMGQDQNFFADVFLPLLLNSGCYLLACVNKRWQDTRLTMVRVNFEEERMMQELPFLNRGQRMNLINLNYQLEAQPTNGAPLGFGTIIRWFGIANMDLA